MSYADHKEASPSLGAANKETVATFVGSWEAQRSGLIRRQNRMRPRRPWGLRTAEMWLLSWAPGKPSGVTSYANSNEASPSLRAANCETVATLVGPGGSSGVVPHADQNEASPALKGMRTAKRSPRSWALGSSGGVVSYTQIRMRPRRPLGAANSETVATFVGCWRVQRSDLIRKSE